MSEQPFSDQPVAPSPDGWENIASQYKDWHPGLHEHVERLLEANGISEPVDVAEELPQYDIPVIKADLLMTHAERMDTIFNGTFVEKVDYGSGELDALFKAGEVEVIRTGLDNYRFKNMDDADAKKLLGAGLVKELSTKLNEFHDLDETTAQTIIDQGNAMFCFIHKDRFTSFDQTALAKRAAETGQGFGVMHTLKYLPEVDPESLLPILQSSGQNNAILEGILEHDCFKSVDQQALVEKLIASGSIQIIMWKLDKLPGVDKVALLDSIEASGNANDRAQLFHGAKHFPTADFEAAASFIIENGDTHVRTSLAYFADKNMLSNETLKKYAETCISNGDTMIVQNLEKFPPGTVDHQALANAMIAKVSQPGEIGDIKTMLTYIDRFSGLSADTVDRILAADPDAMYRLEDFLDSFATLSMTTAQALCVKYNGPEKVLENFDRFVGDRQQVLDVVLNSENFSGIYALIKHIDKFPDQEAIVAETLFTKMQPYGVMTFVEHMDKFSPQYRTEAIDHLVQGEARAVHLLISRYEEFGLNKEQLVDRLSNSGKEVLAKLAADEQLMYLLPANGPFGAAFGTSALRLLLATDKPDQVIDDLHNVVKEQSLWVRNLRMSQIAVGSTAEHGHLDGYEVVGMPMSFPVEARDGIYKSAVNLDDFSKLDTDTKRSLLNEAALNGLNEEGLESKDTVGFTELNAQWQENVLAYRLYESIGKSRDESERAAATVRNREFASRGDWLQNGDLVHATKNVISGANVLRNGLLCGEVIGLEGRADMYPYNVDFVQVSPAVLAGEGYEGRLANLKNAFYGDYNFLLHRDQKSTDYGREMGGGINEDHRLVFGAVPATEISALLLRGEAAEAEAAIVMVVEAGMYIPVVDQEGNNILSYDLYHQRRLDGNYEAVEPKVVDNSFKLEGTQSGSNEGSLFVVPNGEAGQVDHYYVKFGDESAEKREHLWTEILADSMYREVAPHLVPETEAVIIDGRFARRSKIAAIDESPITNEARNAGFIMDCLVGNWDAVYNDANLLMSGGKALRIDTGNSFDFRARGDKKNTDQFSERVLEVEIGISADELGGGMRQMYPDITDDAIKEQVKTLRDSLTDAKIDELVHSIRRPSADRLNLSSIVKARKNYLIQKFL